MSGEHDPRMHSAEHILNQTMVRMFDCGRCFSAHLNKKKSKCDYRFARPLSEAEVQELARRVNEQIEADLPVREIMLDRELATERFNLSRLPEDAGDAVRIVHIGDYDACPCIGAHVEHTAQIGAFSIISQDAADGVLRIRFKLATP